MTTPPDTVNLVYATTSLAQPTATTTDQAMPPTAAAPVGAVGGTSGTQFRPSRPDLVDVPNLTFQRVLVGLFVAVPFVALIAAIPLLWGWGLGWHDVILALIFYCG